MTEITDIISAYNNKNDIIKIEIPDSVINIKKHAFENCINL